MPELKDVIFDASVQDCETCVLAKIDKLSFKENRIRTVRPLQTIHTDIMGPYPFQAQISTYRYLLMILQDLPKLSVYK